MCILWTSTKARTLVDRCRVSSGPIRDYKPLESQTPFQIDAESLIVFTRPIAYLSETQANTDQVVRAHDRAQSCLHGPFKRGIVDLELSSLVDIFLHREISLKIHIFYVSIKLVANVRMTGRKVVSTLTSALMILAASLSLQEIEVVEGTRTDT